MGAPYIASKYEVLTLSYPLLLTFPLAEMQRIHKGKWLRKDDIKLRTEAKYFQQVCNLNFYSSGVILLSTIHIVHTKPKIGNEVFYSCYKYFLNIFKIFFLMIFQSSSVFSAHSNLQNDQNKPHHFPNLKLLLQPIFFAIFFIHCVHTSLEVWLLQTKWTLNATYLGSSGTYLGFISYLFENK